MSRARQHDAPRRGSRAVASCLALLLVAPALVHAQTVDDVVARHAGGCTTEGVEGLSGELVRSHLCAYPGVVAQLTPHPGITLTHSRVHPLGTRETVDAVRAAADRTALSITSAFRTLVEQYLLYEEGGCGLAAVPGNSNHQSGLAVDLSNYEAARPAMVAAGCTQTYPSSDPVHYDCPGADMRAASVLVFQRLWNLAHPEDRIAEDGRYGPMTRARLGSSPAAGFGVDLCGPTPVARWGAELVGQIFDDPLVLSPGEEVLGTIELRNIGTETWGASTRVGTTGPRDRDSPFAGPDWLAPNRAAAVEGAVAPGETYPFTFTLRAPAAPGVYDESFGVVEGEGTWFSDPEQLGPPDDRIVLRVTVLAPVLAPVEPADGGASPAPDAGPGGGAVTSGCGCVVSPRQSAPRWLLLALALLLVRRSARSSRQKRRPSSDRE